MLKIVNKLQSYSGTVKEKEVSKMAFLTPQ